MEKKERKNEGHRKKTRPDTRPIPIADGWVGADMRVFPLSTRADGPTDRRTNSPTDGPTDKASYRVACPQLKTLFCLIIPYCFIVY